MSWTTKDGRAFNTSTGATSQRNRSTDSHRRGHEKTTGAMADHRAALRAQAEGRNEVTEPKRRKRYRTDAEYRAKVDAGEITA